MNRNEIKLQNFIMDKTIIIFSMTDFILGISKEPLLDWWRS